MKQTWLADRLGRYVQLGDAEREALVAVGGSDRVVPRGAVVRSEQAPARDLYVVRSGWLYSSLLMADGRRQLLSLHLPGEFADTTVLGLDTLPFSLIAASDAVLCAIDRGALRAMLLRQPRLALLFVALAEVERVALYDRLASLGRTSARARIAALFCDVLRRLRAAGEVVTDGVPMPLTQEEIGDATGLTAVHVNRMIRRLSDDGLIVRTNGHIRILDEAGLARLGHHSDRYAAIDTRWPPADS